MEFYPKVQGVFPKVQGVFPISQGGAHQSARSADTARYLEGGNAKLTAGDVRRMFLGEVGISSVVEARVRGFNAGDADGAADDAKAHDAPAIQLLPGFAELFDIDDG